MKPNENHYNLRNQTDFRQTLIRTVYHRSGSVCNLGPNVWNAVPEKEKPASSIGIFKKSVRKWMPEKLPLQTLYTIHKWSRIVTKKIKAVIQFIMTKFNGTPKSLLIFLLFIIICRF